jgi:chromosome partitioning protein
MIKIAITNQKGGVGKTTVAFNLSWILAKRFNKKVLLIDNDPQGNLSSSFSKQNTNGTGKTLELYDEKIPERVKISDCLHFLGADINLAPVAERAFPVIFNLKNGLSQMVEEPGYDIVIIDCLPSFGHLNLAALVAADFVLIPVRPSPYALSGMQDLIRTITMVKKNLNSDLRILGIVINQIEGRKTVLQNDMKNLLHSNFQDLVFKSMIRKKIKLEESPLFQKDITSYHQNCPSAEEFIQLTKELLKRIKDKKKNEK